MSCFLEEEADRLTIKIVINGDYHPKAGSFTLAKDLACDPGLQVARTRVFGLRSQHAYPAYDRVVSVLGKSVSHHGLVLHCRSWAGPSQPASGCAQTKGAEITGYGQDLELA